MRARHGQKRPITVRKRVRGSRFQAVFGRVDSDRERVAGDHTTWPEVKPSPPSFARGGEVGVASDRTLAILARTQQS